MPSSSCNFRTPFPVVLYFRFGNSTFFFFNSSRMSSTTNCITKINNVGARFSPCVTPQPYLKLIYSLPMLKNTLKSPCNFSTHFAHSSGAPIFFKAKDITLCLILSWTFTRSIKISHEQTPCPLLHCVNKNRFCTTYFWICTKLNWVSILLQ